MSDSVGLDVALSVAARSIVAPAFDDSPPDTTAAPAPAAPAAPAPMATPALQDVASGETTSSGGPSIVRPRALSMSAFPESRDLPPATGTSESYGLLTHTD